MKHRALRPHRTRSQRHSGQRPVCRPSTNRRDKYGAFRQRHDGAAFPRQSSNHQGRDALSSLKHIDMGVRAVADVKRTRLQHQGCDVSMQVE